MSKSLCVRRGGSAAVLLCSAVCASGLLLDLSGASSTYSEITHLFGEVHGASYIVAELLCSLPGGVITAILAVLLLAAALFALFRRAGRGASPAGESASALNRGASESEGTGVLVRSASTAEDGMPRFARGASAADAGILVEHRCGGGASAWVVAVLFAAAMLFGRSRLRGLYRWRHHPRHSFMLVFHRMAAARAGACRARIRRSGSPPRAWHVPVG